MEDGSSRGVSMRLKSLLALACAALMGLSACGGGGSDATGLAAGLEGGAGANQPLQSPAALNPAITSYRVTQLPIPSESGFVGRNGINASGQVAGSYAAAEGGQGFLFDGTSTTFFSAPPPAAPGDWRTSVLFVNGINASGQVVGTYDFENLADERLSGQEAFSWTRTGGFVRVTPGLSGSALGVNDAGQVVGSRLSHLLPLGSEGFLWSPQAGLRTDFGADTQLAEAAAVNASGRIAGHGTYRGQFGALLVDPAGGTTSLLIGAQDYARVGDLNDAGDVAGEVLTPGDRFHAFIANPTSGRGLVNLGPLVGEGNDSFVQDLNERSEVVLQARLFDRPAATRVASFFWSRDGGMIEMKPPLQANTIPVAINNHSLVVGYHDEWNGGQYVGSRAFAWTRESGLVDLASRVQNPPVGFRLHAALAVNDAGTIVASSDSGLVLLTPLTAPPSGEPPVVGPIAPDDAVEAGRRVAFSAEFTDADRSETHTATWNWGDGSAPQAGNASGSAGAGRVTASHVFKSAGVYTVRLRITDSGGRSTELSRELVVHDRAAGFIKGGGWIASPAGAHKAEPTAAGQAHFKFVAKYKKNGNSRKEHSKLSFTFRTEELRFRGKALDSLVVEGARARIEGTGSLDGQGGYRFLITAFDGSQKKDDRLRIRIWRPDPQQGTDGVVYDNLIDPGSEGSPIGGGTIVVRTR